MYLKPNHPHVGSDGQVYLPYLHEWKPHSHTLIELIIAMSSVFSADPPVFTRTTPAPAPPPPPAYSSNPGSEYASPQTTTTTTNYASGAGVSGYMSPGTQHQLEQQLAEEAAEANRVAQLARNAQEEEERQTVAQLEWDAKNLDNTKKKVRQKIYAYLLEHSKQLQRDMVVDYQDQKKLQNSNFEQQMETIKQQKATLEEQHKVLDEKTEEIQEWLLQAQTKPAAEQQLNVDDLVVTEKPIHEQMLQLSAENASLTDAMYFLDKALHVHTLDMPTHLKEVRRLAKKQFLVRAHLVKINQTLMQQG